MIVSARRRFSLSGICRAMMAAVWVASKPRRRCTRFSCIVCGAETTTTRSTSRSPPVSSSNGISRTASGFPANRTRRKNAASSCLTMGCRMLSSCLRASGLPSTARRNATRSTAPFSTVPGKAASMAATARPPRPCSLWTAASASNTGMPPRRNTAAAVDFPIPIPPVSPMIFIRQSGPRR